METARAAAGSVARETTADAPGGAAVVQSAPVMVAAGVVLAARVTAGVLRGPPGPLPA